MATYTTTRFPDGGIVHNSRHVYAIYRRVGTTNRRRWWVGTLPPCPEQAAESEEEALKLMARALGVDQVEPA